MKFHSFRRSGSPLAACVVGFALSALSANAATIIKPTAIDSVSSTQPGNGAAIGVIDGSGLSSALNTGDALTAANTATHGTWTNNDGWSFSQNDAVLSPNEFITFDLGASYSLTGLYFWQFTRTAFSNEVNRGLTKMDIYVAGADKVFGGTPTFQIGSATSNALNLALDADVNGTPDGSEPSQFRAFTASDVRYVKFTNLDAPSGDQFQGGFSEVRFAGTAAAVPEPSAALLGGLGLLALLRRRR